MATENIVYLRPSKDPGATLDYAVDLTDWLAESPGDTITSATLGVVDPADLVVQSPTMQGTLAVLWISGGTDGNHYLIPFTVRTSGGRTDVFVAVLDVLSEMGLAA